MVLNFIKEFIAEHGYSPSYRETMAGLEIRSISTVAEHVDNLVAKGYLLKKDGSARSLEPIEPAVTKASTINPVEINPASAVPAKDGLKERFLAKMSELEAKLPESASDIEAIKKAAELLGINLS